MTLNRVEQVLSKITNDELLLLEGHLLIEDFLTHSLEQEFGKEILSILDLTFYKKTILCAGVIKIPRKDPLIDTILGINALRNKLAHRLDLDIKAGFTNIIKRVYSNLPKTIDRKTTYSNSVKRTFYLILGQISDVNHASVTLRANRSIVLWQKR